MIEIELNEVILSHDLIFSSEVLYTEVFSQEGLLEMVNCVGNLSNWSN